MGCAYCQPLAILGIAVPVPMYFGLGPWFLVLNAAQHLSSVQQVDKRAQWSGKSSEHQNFLTAMSLFLNGFHRLLDCRMVEK
jgi:hypothetical protein